MSRNLASCCAMISWILDDESGGILLVEGKVGRDGGGAEGVNTKGELEGRGEGG